MKKQVSNQEIKPALTTVVIVLVVVGAVCLLWHAATDKPIYPGMNAPHPASEMGKGPDGRYSSNVDANMAFGQPTSNDQTRTMSISGMPPSKLPGQ